jgi:hypothetical protein
MPTIEPIWLGQSAAGRLVSVTRETNEYQGAQPFYVIAYGKPRRYTPVEARALAIRDRFLADVTDPVRLAASADAAEQARCQVGRAPVPRPSGPVDAYAADSRAPVEAAPGRRRAGRRGRTTTTGDAAMTEAVRRPS